MSRSSRAVLSTRRVQQTNCSPRRRVRAYSLHIDILLSTVTLILRFERLPVTVIPTRLGPSRQPINSKVQMHSRS